jgi:transcriptional regulator with XRE-family HTH domain
VAENAVEQARKAAGISRAEMVNRLGTTVHHYWQVERNPQGADPDLTIRAHEALGIPLEAVSSSGEGTSPREGQRQEGEGPTMRVWRCLRCQWETTQPGNAVAHKCPRYGYKIVQLRLVV